MGARLLTPREHCLGLSVVVVGVFVVSAGFDGLGCGGLGLGFSGLSPLPLPGASPDKKSSKPFEGPEPLAHDGGNFVAPPNSLPAPSEADMSKKAPKTFSPSSEVYWLPHMSSRSPVEGELMKSVNFSPAARVETIV